MDKNNAVLLQEPVYIDKITPTLKPEKTPQSGAFSPMLQGAGTNKLTQLSARKAPPAVDAITGIATITNGNLTVFIEKYNHLTGGLRISTHKLLDACTIALTAQNDYRGAGEPNTLVAIPLEDYMTRCGKPITKSSKDEMRKKVKQDLEALYNTSIEWSEPSGKNTRDFAKMRICDAVAIKNGKIIMNFSNAIAKYLTHAYIMQYPTELFKADERNPNSYYIGKKLLQHNSMDNNHRKGTANIISVKSLLESCPDIPSYEDVIASDGAVDRRIRTAFETSLNALNSFIKWEYSNSKGVPLTDEQLKNFNYSVFSKLYILFEALNVPDQSQRMQAKADHAKRSSKKNVSVKEM